MTVSELLLPEFDEEMKNTRKILERIPDDFHFKPHEKSMELGRLASHIAELPLWAKHTLAMEVLDLEPGTQGYSAKSRQELLEKFDSEVAEARKLIAGATDDEWKKTWTLKFAGDTIISMPKYAVMRSMVMSHLIHHRAQLGVYLRLNEVELPGMYGPSADEMKFWTAKQSA
jgi:uncharacterized damage-inducible protein DinB